MTPGMKRFAWWTTVVGYGACVIAIAWFAGVLAGQNRRYVKIIEAPRLARQPDIEGNQWLAAQWYVQTDPPAFPFREGDLLAPLFARSILLLFVADDCESCNTAVQRWSAAVAASSAVRAFEYFVAYEARAPVTTPEGVRPTLLRIRDVDAVRYRLGVRTVPFAVLLDQTGKMRAAIVGLPSQATVAKCIGALKAYPGGPGFLMKYESPSQPFKPAAVHAPASLVQ